MNSNELILAMKQIEKERNIKSEVLIDAIEAALVSAYKRNYNVNTNVRASMDPETGAIGIFASKSVVEKVENPNSEISLAEAKKINPLYEVGDVLEVEAFTKDFGRIAAQTAKQVVIQRIREAEQGAIFDEFAEKEGEILTAIVQRVEKNGVYVEFGKTDGIIPFNEVIQGETYAPGDRIKAYVLKAQRNNKAPQVLISRTHPGLVKRLFELEVPEIQSGVVVVSFDPNVDAVGACVGPKGIRVERIVQEIHNEKIDIIEWDPDIAVYIAKALSPARVIMVYINEDEKAAKVVVPDAQLSLAIGKEGQNARLAAKLTGWKIDIKSQSQVEADALPGDEGAEGEADDDDLFADLAGEDEE